MLLLQTVYMFLLNIKVNYSQITVFLKVVVENKFLVIEKKNLNSYISFFTILHSFLLNLVY